MYILQRVGDTCWKEKTLLIHKYLNLTASKTCLGESLPTNKKMNEKIPPPKALHQISLKFVGIYDEREEIRQTQQMFSVSLLDFLGLYSAPTFRSVH